MLNIKKRVITKLSIISNKQGFIYSVIPFDIKNINIAYSTSVHDVKMIKKKVLMKLKILIIILNIII